MIDNNVNNFRHLVGTSIKEQLVDIYTGRVSRYFHCVDNSERSVDQSGIGKPGESLKN